MSDSGDDLLTQLDFRAFHLGDEDAGRAYEEITRLRERCEAYKAQVKDGADVIAGLRERLAEANDESEKCIKLIAEMVSRKQVYVAELFTGSGYRCCIVEAFPGMERDRHEFGRGPDAQKAADEVLRSLKGDPNA